MVLCQVWMAEYPHPLPFPSPPPPSLPLGLLSSGVLAAFWLSPAIAQPDIAYDAVGVATFCIAAVTELLAEPLWILAQIHHYSSLKVWEHNSSYVPSLLCTVQ